MKKEIARYHQSYLKFSLSFSFSFGIPIDFSVTSRYLDSMLEYPRFDRGSEPIIVTFMSSRCQPKIISKIKLLYALIVNGIFSAVIFYLIN